MRINRALPPLVRNRFPYAVTDGIPIYFKDLQVLETAQRLLEDAADKILKTMENRNVPEIKEVILEYKIHPARELSSLGRLLTEKQLGYPIIAIFSDPGTISPISMYAGEHYLKIESNGVEAVRAVLLGLESIVQVAGASLEQVRSVVTDNRPVIDNINATHLIPLPASTGLFELKKTSLTFMCYRDARPHDPSSPIVRELTAAR